MIYHLALRADWEAARATGEYPWSTRGRTLRDEGFVHCSHEHQWRAVRSRFYSDLADDELVLLVVDETKLTSPVVVERIGGAPDEFPHVYGPLDVGAVIGERSVTRD